MAVDFLKAAVLYIETEAGAGPLVEGFASHQLRQTHPHPVEFSRIDEGGGVNFGQRILWLRENALVISTTSKLSAP